MLLTATQSNIRTAAQELAEANRGAEPAITAVYLFPSETEIRLVYLDPTTAPSRGEQVLAPFYFGADTAGGVDYPSAIALIRPEEKESLSPPTGWGSWDEAELLWKV